VSEWHQEKKIKWPSRQPAWTMGSFYIAFLVLAGMLVWQYKHDWTSLQRYYLPIYAKTWMEGSNPAKSYDLLYLINRQGRERLALNGEVEAESQPDGKTVYVLLKPAINHGWLKAALDAAVPDDQDVKATELHAYLRHWIFRDQTAWDYLREHEKWVLWFWVVLFIFGYARTERDLRYEGVVSMCADLNLSRRRSSTARTVPTVSAG
jgi:hypothetical protein